eukprot:10080189-Heterocapsa_arctica.AAC.1
MNAGALRTIITDGVWYPERANKMGKMMMGCVYFANVVSNEVCSTFGGNVKPDIKKHMNSEPQCLWTTGVITKEYTALPGTVYMKAEDTRHDSIEKAQKVYIDGSATKIGA